MGMRFNRRALAFATLALIATAAGCGAPQPPTPVSATASAPPSPAFSAQNVTNLSASLTLPKIAGFAGTLATQALYLPYTQVTTTLTNEPQTPSLGNQSLVYIGLAFTFEVPAAPMTLTVQIPKNAVIPGASYYLALWDPQRPSLGWQHAFSGPATPSTSSGVPTLRFAAQAPLFNRYEQYRLAIYMIPSGSPRPTPAPSISPVVTPTPSPTTLANVQLQLTNSCSGTPCATGSIAPPTQGPQQHWAAPVASPVVGPTSGQSMELSILPMPELPGDVLYYTPSLGEFPLATHFVWSFYVWVDAQLWDPLLEKPLLIKALEFDMNFASPGEPGLDYNFSSQCLMNDRANGDPVWQIWGKKGAGTGWIDSGIVCYPYDTFYPNEWHHIIWQYGVHPDTQQTEYVSLTIDPERGGMPQIPRPSLNPGSPLKKQARPTLEVQVQQDALGIPSPVRFNEWIDDATLTFW